MGRSSLLGVEQADLESEGHDNAALGPSDSSDSGSDMVGVDELGDGDPNEPVDVALGRDLERPLMPVDSLNGATSDRGGSGERRSAGSDAGEEASDISVDRVFSTGDASDADQDAALEDALDQAVYEDVLDDEDVADEEDEAIANEDLAIIARSEREMMGEDKEDESADPVGDGHSDAEAAAKTAPHAKPAQKPLPAKAAGGKPLKTKK
ncbi:hypothetical protein LRH25_03065 [Ideonella azotifigens]|uniref:Uncharacterized protein n=1 Tax=Ideonella azotifigens TaxID=513160 RepID=A0ABN1KKI3_9BURK|nr:hypothetical protein [Ideonella azotifigens]MCD2339315.1 hypothetical protein [Ideonella azotifigens]